MAAQHVPSVGSHVIVSGGKKAGTVTSLITEGRGDVVSGFVVHYGWRGRKAKIVPIEDVKWVNPDNVVLTLSRKQFDHLANWTPSSTQEQVTGAGPTGGTAANEPAHP